MEQLCVPEYLRGEAGYAYTNLYGAYQFLQDLDLTKEPFSLSISADALQDAISSFQTKQEQQLQTLQQRTISAMLLDNYVPISEQDTITPWTADDQPPLVVVSPTPLDIRQARLRGEVIDFDWAIQWQEKNAVAPALLSSSLSNNNTNNNNSKNHQQLTHQRSVLETAEDGLPFGFRRNYSFLTVRSPDDIRYSDISPLLNEYHMLVRTTEALLGERAMKVASERKAKLRAREQQFYTAVQSLDATATTTPSPES
jgi:hypothetical protein